MHSCRPGLWATAREAREHLGVSERTLARWRNSGLFRAGQHWRRKFPSPNSPVLYHLEHCQVAMSKATARQADLLEIGLAQTSAGKSFSRPRPVADPSRGEAPGHRRCLRVC
ncbi:helix-turn-helix domain-containing protein [Synechococcus sp. CCY9202]|uniref:helix-turn-helix domain-containing protein n=1 Tax=Synechococcus sp. CCY9202 TaxID=174698 RepID=UPI002B21C630|nr:helix-turn-helix domain-containing protein [Synechococcus sp. CCY9202]MEA5424689.1 helix-turn-helix domain-containing protein [Synechococcus sp. CCY9202]